MSESVVPRVLEILQRQYPCQEVPFGAWMEIAQEVGVSRERVRQIAARGGWVHKNGLSAAMKRKPVRACASCGEPVKSKSDFCVTCNTIEMPCAHCGKMVKRSLTYMVSRGKRKEGWGQRAFCGSVCLGRWLGQNHGFAAHPENIPSGAEALRKKRALDSGRPGG